MHAAAAANVVHSPLPCPDGPPPANDPPLARHYLAEYYGCGYDVLNDIPRLEELLRGAAAAARTTLVGVHLHHFAPQGVSGVAILAESHIALHTWPELGFASIEIYVCGQEGDPDAGHAYLLERLRPQHTRTRLIPRGSQELLRRFPGGARG